MASLKERFDKWKNRKWHQKAGDIIFWLFLIMLIIPGPRKTIATTVNKVFLNFRSPSVTTEDKAYQLSEEELNWDISYADGSKVDPNNYKGEVVFLNFWGTYCPPCIAELPEIQELYNDYKDKVRFILVSAESPAKVESFLKDKGFELPAFYGGRSMPEALSVRSIPTTFIISKDGKIISKKIGAAHWNGKATRELLDRLGEE